MTVLVMTLVLGSFLMVGLAQPSQAKSVTVHFRDTLVFDPDVISADPGEELVFTFVNDGATRHSFTLYAERDPSVPLDDETALQDYNATHTKLLDVWLQGGEQTTVTINAPSEAGTYVFVCMAPLHAVADMHGRLLVGVSTGISPLIIGVIVGVVAVVVVVAFFLMRRGSA